MSRAYKDSIRLDIDVLNGAGAAPNASICERLSGADLEAIRLAAKVSATASTTATDGGKAVLGTNSAFPGTPSNAALTGSDIEWSAGTL